MEAQHVLNAIPLEGGYSSIPVNGLRCLVLINPNTHTKYFIYIYIYIYSIALIYRIYYKCMKTNLNVHALVKSPSDQTLYKVALIMLMLEYLNQLCGRILPYQITGY